MSLKITGGFSPTGRINVKLLNVLPAAIGMVTATAITASSATLNFVLTPNTTYEYSFNGLTWSPLPANRTITGLAGTTSYGIRVRGKNKYGAGAASSPVSFTTLSASTTWNVARTPTGNLSGLTLSTTFSGVTAFSVATRSNQKVYAEFRSFGETYIGVANLAVDSNGTLTQKSLPCFNNSEGALILNNNYYNRASSGSNGDIVMMAWNGFKAWFGRNGTWLFGPPDSTNPDHGIPISVSGGSAAASVFGSSSSVTANFGPNFTYTVPPGYSAW